MGEQARVEHSKPPRPCGLQTLRALEAEGRMESETGTPSFAASAPSSAVGPCGHGPTGQPSERAGLGDQKQKEKDQHQNLSDEMPNKIGHAGKPAYQPDPPDRNTGPTPTDRPTDHESEDASGVGRSGRGVVGSRRPDSGGDARTPGGNEIASPSRT